MHSNEQWALEMVQCERKNKNKERRFFFSSVCDNIHCRHIRSFSLLGYMFFFRAVEDINRVLFTHARKLCAVCICWDQHTCVAFQSPHRNRSSYKSKGKCTSKNGNNNDIREKSQQLAIESSICMECVTFCPVRTQFVAAFNVCMFVFFSFLYHIFKFSSHCRLQFVRFECIELIFPCYLFALSCVYFQHCFISNGQISAVSAVATLCKCDVWFEYIFHQQNVVSYWTMPYCFGCSVLNWFLNRF